jgi:Recombination endonuclease VII
MRVSEAQRCPECEKEFLPYNNRKNVIFCSYLCQVAFQVRQRREVRQAAIVMVPCLRCGTEFVPAHGQRYCSEQCKVAAKQQRVAKILARECEICRQSFMTGRSQAKFCSPACRQEGAARRKRANYSPERNSVYQSDYRTRNNMAVRRSRYKNWYGVSLETYDDIFSQQEGRCAICSVLLVAYDRGTHLDHRHGGDQTIRGILCSSCNTGIGMMADNPERLRAAANYLERHAAPVEPGNVIPLRKESA